MKRKPTKVHWTLSLTKKNATPHFKVHCTKIDISLVIHFFFSQTNVVFKYNPLFIDILDSFCHSLFTFYLLIFNFIIRICQFIQCLYAFFIKTSKVFIRFNVVISCLIFHEKIWPVNMELLLTDKITPGLNKLCKSCTVLCMLAFGVWLWPQLKWSSTVCICQVTFLRPYFQKEYEWLLMLNFLCFNFQP